LWIEADRERAQGPYCYSGKTLDASLTDQNKAKQNKTGQYTTQQMIHLEMITYQAFTPSPRL
jgi:hypothetical protein